MGKGGGRSHGQRGRAETVAGRMDRGRPAFHLDKGGLKGKVAAWVHQYVINAGTVVVHSQCMLAICIACTCAKEGSPVVSALYLPVLVVEG